MNHIFEELLVDFWFRQLFKDHNQRKLPSINLFIVYYGDHPLFYLLNVNVGDIRICDLQT